MRRMQLGVRMTIAAVVLFAAHGGPQIAQASSARASRSAPVHLAGPTSPVCDGGLALELALGVLATAP